MICKTKIWIRILIWQKSCFFYEESRKISNSYSYFQNLLSVPGQSRQVSTESIPDYLQRSRSDAGYYPHHAQVDTRGLEVAKSKRVLTPPLHENITGNFARKKFHRSENNSFSNLKEQQSLEESPKVANHVSPSRQSQCLASPDNQHIAKKKRAMYKVFNT